MEKGPIYVSKLVASKGREWGQIGSWSVSQGLCADPGHPVVVSVAELGH